MNLDVGSVIFLPRYNLADIESAVIAGSIISNCSETRLSFNVTTIPLFVRESKSDSEKSCEREEGLNFAASRSLARTGRVEHGAGRGF